MARTLALLLALSVLGTACGTTRSGDTPTPDAAVDATVPVDAATDAGATDSGGASDSGPVDGAAHDAAVAGDGGMCGGSLMQSPSCESCLESMCCMEVTTCNATPGCPMVFECLHRCASGDGTCYEGCLSGMSGVGESSQVDGCILMHCPPSCRAM